MSKKIAIIGGGNLGSAIAEGLINSDFLSPANLMISKRNVHTLQPLAKRGVNVSGDNNEAASFGDVIIIAVKPFQVQEVLLGIKARLEESRHMLVSVVTGVYIRDIYTIIEKQLPVFRAMPNTAIAIAESMTCICSQYASLEQVSYVEQAFDQLGKTITIDEKLMDAATVLGACGTAFAMRYIRANIQGGIEIGFSASVASLIAAQTVKGAADLLLKNNSHPEQEIDKVTTPQGCTIAGLNEMEHQGFSSSLIKGLTASYKKITTDM
jgi:pyrroline-5-carboxylate reductase